MDIPGQCLDIRGLEDYLSGTFTGDGCKLKQQSSLLQALCHEMLITFFASVCLLQFGVKCVYSRESELKTG